jgi:hypothetical protein
MDPTAIAPIVKLTSPQTSNAFPFCMMQLQQMLANRAASG